MTILSKNAIFRPKTELEAIARWSVDASREVDCAYFGNIGRNSGYFLLPIFLGSYLIVESLNADYTDPFLKLLSGNIQVPKNTAQCAVRWLPKKSEVRSTRYFCLCYHNKHK